MTHTKSHEERPRVRSHTERARSLLAAGAGAAALLLGVTTAPSMASPANWTNMPPGETLTNPLAFAPAQPVSSSLPTGPLDGLAVGDVNGDDKPDMVVANNQNGGTVDVIGNPAGSGSFSAAYPVGNFPYAVTLADVNGDGLPDIVVANDGASTGDQTISVLLNNPSSPGTFEPAASYSIAGVPSAVAVADLNGDGRPDIVVAGGQDDSVYVLLNNGDGTFGAAHTYPTGQTPDDVVVGDFNHDGSPDIATADYTGGTISVLYGNGDGTFAAPVALDGGDHPYRLVSADFNGDGYPDLAVLDDPTPVTNGTDELQVLLNRGVSGSGAGFDSPSVVATLPNQSTEVPSKLAMGDLNGDGLPDLVVSDGSTSDVYPGNGDGTFGSGATVGTGNALDIAVADMNGDGAPDIVTTTDSTTQGQVEIAAHELPPVNLSAPTLGATALVGESDQALPGTWSSAVSPSYDWQEQRCDSSGGSCVDITNPNGNTFVIDPTTDDVGSTLRLGVTAVNDAGTGGPVYTNTTDVVPPLPVATTPPTITGEPLAGNRVTAGHDKWNTTVHRDLSWWVCPAGDSDPADWGNECQYAGYHNPIRVKSAWVGMELEAVVEGYSSTRGEGIATTGLVRVLAMTPSDRTLPHATAGHAIARTFTASGGTAPWTWSVSSGRLPAGLTLDQSSGVLAGTPTAAGKYTFTVRASDSSSPAEVATRTYTLTVQMAIAPAKLPRAAAQQPYSESLSASGGTAPYTWAVTSGSLPSGLTLSPGGTISGTPETSGKSTFTVQVTDSASPSLHAKHTYTLTVG